MARPSLKNGFTRIHNELIERALCKVNLSAYEYRILWAIIRLSWGWNKRDCYSSYRELSNLTGIDGRNIQRTVKTLEQKFIITTGNGSKKTRFEVNTDYMTWRVLEKDTLFTSSERETDVDAVVCRDYTPVVCRDYTPVVCRDYTPVVCRDYTHRSESVEPVSVAPCLKKEEKKLIKETDDFNNFITALTERMKI